MPVLFRIRNTDGAPWYSGSGGNAHMTALRACIENSELTVAARELLERLLVEQIDDVAIVDSSEGLKLVCKRPKCRITIILSRPKRHATAVNLDRLAGYLAGDAVKPIVIKSESFLPPIASEPYMSADMSIRARAALMARGIDNPPDATVKAVAAHIVRKGTLPAELELWHMPK